MSIHSELVIGLVGGTGTNFNQIINYINGLLNNHFDEIHPIRLSKLIHEYFNISPYHGDSFLEEIGYYQDQCDQLAKKNSAIMGILAIDQIKKSREVNKSNAYIINSLKRNNEFKVLNRVYGQNFILISIYEPKESRLNHLINEEQLRKPATPHDIIEGTAKKIITRDKHDDQSDYGQSVRATYINATYFVRSDTYEEDIKRLFNVLRGDPIETPTKDEMAMAHAQIAALRSADLYRQVGAVITDDDANIISTGCNEVPKYGGGYYWGNGNDKYDLRDYFVHEHGMPITQKIKETIAKDLIDSLKEQISHIKKLSKLFSCCENQLVEAILHEGSIKDLIEFLRPVHGEEAAICTAALKGVSTKNTTLYCNTYPCHLCTKKIIACGIKRVVYIHPYPKSRAEDLYSGIIIDKPEHPEEVNDKVIFESYRGFSPKKYPYVFNLKYKKRYNDSTKLIIPREEITFHPQIIYVSNYTPLGYLLKEKAYVCWLTDNYNEKSITNNDTKDNDLDEYFKMETAWLLNCVTKKSN